MLMMKREDVKIKKQLLEVLQIQDRTGQDVAKDSLKVETS